VFVVVSYYYIIYEYTMCGFGMMGVFLGIAGVAAVL